MRTRLLLALTALAPLAGCDAWPLHAHLPDPYEEPIVVPYTEDVAEDVGVAEGSLQDLGSFTAPSTLTISGDVSSCGWDAAAEWPAWPDRPVDSDGDGVTDGEQPWYAGWYAGDVDWYAVELDGGAWFDATMSWDNPPADGVNAPYQPPDDGPWQTESDLDFVLFDRDGAAPGAVLREAGFSRDHPETSGGPLVLAGGDQLVVGVGCHHGVPAGYTLTITLAAP